MDNNAVDEPDDGLSFRGDATYLITGGLRGLGSRVAEWMALRGARHLVLLGRDPGSDAARETARRVEAAGAQVTLLAADMALSVQVEAVIAQIDTTLPPLRGIVHAAGTLADGILATMDDDQFAVSVRTQGRRRPEPAPRNEASRPRLLHQLLLHRLADGQPGAGQLRGRERLPRSSGLAEAKPGTGGPDDPLGPVVRDRHECHRAGTAELRFRGGQDSAGPRRRGAGHRVRTGRPRGRRHAHGLGDVHGASGRPRERIPFWRSFARRWCWKFNRIPPRPRYAKNSWLPRQRNAWDSSRPLLRPSWPRCWRSIPRRCRWTSRSTPWVSTH